MTIEMTSNVAQVTGELNAILARVQDPVRFFDWVGKRQKKIVKNRIQYTKTDPDGRQWTPWTSFTEIKRQMAGNVGQGIMWDSGALLNSVRYDVDGTFGVDIGSDIWYAPLQQDGGGRIPSRQIFGWEEASLPQMALAFVRHLEGVPL